MYPSGITDGDEFAEGYFHGHWEWANLNIERGLSANIRRLLRALKLKGCLMRCSNLKSTVPCQDR